MAAVAGRTGLPIQGCDPNGSSAGGVHAPPKVTVTAVHRDGATKDRKIN
jgi:hypothetical protein